jgi:hypothetical protein
MRFSFLFTIVACLAGVVLGGCAGSPSVAPGQSSAMPHLRAALKPPPPCVPKVWATSLSPSAVYGFTGASTSPCVTLIGPYAGLNLNNPITVAVSRKPKLVYVADLGNDRIVAFTYNGTYVKWLDTTTGGSPYQPWGVCISPKGIVGVGNRQYNDNGAPGNVEFFARDAPAAGTPSGVATGVFISDQYCAFDRRGNFFVDGQTSSGEEIAYLPRADVDLLGQTLVNSGLGTGAYWAGMYSRIDTPADDTLSVGTSTPITSTQTIMNWRVSGPAIGPLTFSALPAYILTSYPVGGNSVYQLAPTTGGSTGSVLVDDYGAGQVLTAPANGGTTLLYDSVTKTTGVATRPTGQY